MSIRGYTREKQAQDRQAQLGHGLRSTGSVHPLFQHRLVSSQRIRTLISYINLQRGPVHADRRKGWGRKRTGRIQSTGEVFISLRSPAELSAG